MKYTFIIFCFLFSSNYANTLINNYGFLQNIEFKLYTKDIPPQKVLSNNQTAEEILMYDVIHAVLENEKWVAYTTNKNLLGLYKVGGATIIQNNNGKKIFFIANFPGSKGGTDLYMAEYLNETWTKPKNMGKNINTPYNESNPGMLDENTLTYSSNGIIKKIDINTFVIDNGDDFQFDYTAQTSNLTTSNTAITTKIEQQKLAELEKKLIEQKQINEQKLAEEKLAKEKIALQEKLNTTKNKTNSTTDPISTNDNANESTTTDNLIDAILATAKKLNAQNESEIQAELTKKNKTSKTTIAPKVQIPQTPIEIPEVTITTKTIEQEPQNATQTPITPIPTEQKNIISNPITPIINNNIERLGKITVAKAKTMFPLAIQIGAYLNPNWNTINQISSLGGQITTFQNESNLNIVWLTGFNSTEEMLSTLNKVKANANFNQAFVTK